MSAKATCDRYFSEVVRARGYCERCGTSVGPFECAHIIRRRFVGDPDGIVLRHNEDNALCLCRVCHMTVDADPVQMAMLIDRTIGLDKYDELLAVKNAAHRPWREKDWIVERDRLRDLKKALA